MDKLLVDTNVVLDLLMERKEFYQSASHLFTLADQKKVELGVSSLTFANANYLLSRQYNAAKARELLRSFKVLVSILPMTEKVIELSLNSKFNDFEDAIQYYSALENNMGIIITRNLKDFKLAEIPVMGTGDYLGLQGI